MPEIKEIADAEYWRIIKEQVDLDELDVVHSHMDERHDMSEESFRVFRLPADDTLSMLRMSTAKLWWELRSATASG